MPIANCYIPSSLSKDADFQQLLTTWAELIGVQTSDITLNVIGDFQQFGETYSAMVNLYLPSLWDSGAIEKIASTLSELLQQYLHVKPDEVFIITQMIVSGLVYTKGMVEKW